MALFLHARGFWAVERTYRTGDNFGLKMCTVVKANADKQGYHHLQCYCKFQSMLGKLPDTVAALVMAIAD